MATTLSTQPEFKILYEYTIPNSITEIYTKLSNHHGDQFGKCRITADGKLRVAKIQITDLVEHQQIKGTITLAIWGSNGPLKVRHAHEGKTILKGVAMLLIDNEELPSFLQK